MSARGPHENKTACVFPRYPLQTVELVLYVRGLALLVFSVCHRKTPRGSGSSLWPAAQPHALSSRKCMGWLDGQKRSSIIRLFDDKKILKTMTKSKKFLVASATVAGLLLNSATALMVGASVTPEVVDGELSPGEKMEVPKEVTIPKIPAVVDVAISMDLTGSMGGELAALKTELSDIITDLSTESADLQVGIVSHEDYNGSFNSNPTCSYSAAYGSGVKPDVPYRLDHALDTDFAGADAAVQAMALGFGNDGPESYTRVMYEAGTDAQGDPTAGIGYRAGAQKMLVMFLDNLPHDCDLGDELAGTVTGIDPGRDATIGTADDIDLQDDALQSLIDGDVTLLVINSGGNNAWWNTQAAKTGGSSVQINPDGTVPGGISLSELIINLISEVKTDVWYSTACEAGLNVDLTAVGPYATNPLFPGVHFGVPGGTTVNYDETISVDPSAPEGSTLMCVVTFYANHYLKGEGSIVGKEKITIRVPDRTAPEAMCIETTNPAGKNIPTAPAKGGQGQNQDGYYQLLGKDNVGVASIVVEDSVPAFVSGLFASGDKIKLTQAPGVTPSDTRPGPGVITSHLKLKGDAVVVVTDTSGNVTRASCLVPPKPQ
mgnify:CR=1 FL=1